MEGGVSPANTANGQTRPGVWRRTAIEETFPSSRKNKESYRLADGFFRSTPRRSLLSWQGYVNLKKYDQHHCYGRAKTGPLELPALKNDALPALLCCRSCTRCLAPQPVSKR